MKPICCNQAAKEYRKLYYWPNGVPHSVEAGFKCRVCGNVRIPYSTQPYPDRTEEYEVIRLDGIAFDNSLPNNLLHN